MTGQQPAADGLIPMADGTGVGSLATMLREAKPASPRKLLCSRCAVFHKLACHQALITELSKAIDRERPLVAACSQRCSMPVLNE